MVKAVIEERPVLALPVAIIGWKKKNNIVHQLIIFEIIVLQK